MSRTSDDWERERKNAVEVKRKLEDLYDAVDNFEGGNENCEELLRQIVAELRQLGGLIDQLVGQHTLTWVEEDR